MEVCFRNLPSYGKFWNSGLCTGWFCIWHIGILVICSWLCTQHHKHIHEADQCWVCWISWWVMWSACVFGFPLGMDWWWGFHALISTNLDQSHQSPHSLTNGIAVGCLVPLCHCSLFISYRLKQWWVSELSCVYHKSCWWSVLIRQYVHIPLPFPNHCYQFTSHPSLFQFWFLVKAHQHSIMILFDSPTTFDTSLEHVIKWSGEEKKLFLKCWWSTSSTLLVRPLTAVITCVAFCQHFPK